MSLTAEIDDSSAGISLRSLTKKFRVAGETILAIDSIHLDIRNGEFICIVGPSGCGKTTLLRILAGLEEPTEGSATLAQRDSSKPLTSMIFQENSIFPWMTVRENIGYGLRMRGVPPVQVAPVVEHFMDLSGLTRFADAFTHQLSGGMKQRVSVARAFANGPEVLLMDEPFAALDEQSKIVLQEELLRLWSATRKTVVFITHSIDEALALGDRVVVMTARPGRIKADIQVGFSRPRSVVDLKADAEFGRLWQEIWTLLRG